MQISSQLITHTLTINDQSQRVYLGEDLLLADKSIGFVSLIDGGCQLSNGVETLASGTADFLVLVNSSREIINRLPMAELITQKENGTPISVNGLSVDYSSSYVLRTKPTTAEVGKAYCFVFSVAGFSEPKTPYRDYISVTLPAGSTSQKQLYFPDKQSLRGRAISSISITQGLSQTPNYKAGASNYYIEKTLITLVDTSGQIVVNNVPLSFFVDRVGRLDAYKFGNINIDFPRSYITVCLDNNGTSEDVDFYFNLELAKNW